MLRCPSHIFSSIASLEKIVKSNIYLSSFAYLLWANFDFFLPIEPEYEIVKFIPKAPGGIILDIGAHRGESARSFRIYEKDSPILSIEANPQLEKYLEKLKKSLRNYDYKIACASNSDESLLIYTPVYENISLTQCSSISPEESRSILKERSFLKNLDEKLSFVSSQAEGIILDSLALNPFLIKIDVEGGEKQVLEGLKLTIAKTHPVLMIENNNFEELIKILEPQGYGPYIFDKKEKVLREFKGQKTLNIIYISQNNKNSITYSTT
jgi:FkbM family methyltransferase